MLRAAHALAQSRQMCCEGDLEMLVATVQDLPPNPTVVQLGAGSGTMALAILGTRPRLKLYTIDHDEVNIDWEGIALTNMGFDIKNHKRYVPIVTDASVAGYQWEDGKVDLLVLDAEHDWIGLLAELTAWQQEALPKVWFIHDYDGTNAPNQYPEVKEACQMFFGQPPQMTGGWSAVYKERYRPVP